MIAMSTHGFCRLVCQEKQRQTCSNCKELTERKMAKFIAEFTDMDFINRCKEDKETPDFLDWVRGIMDAQEIL